MSSKFIQSYLVGEFFVFWVKIEGSPSDVMFSCVWMRDLFYPDQLLYQTALLQIPLMETQLLGHVFLFSNRRAGFFHQCFSLCVPTFHRFHIFCNGFQVFFVLYFIFEYIHNHMIGYRVFVFHDFE